VDFAVLHPVLIAVLSPVLLLAGIMFVLVTPKIAIFAMVLSGLALFFGGLDLLPIVSEPYHPSFTFSTVYFLVLAAMAHIRWLRGRRVARKSKVKRMGVTVVSRNAWVLEKKPNENKTYLLPRTLAAGHRDYAESDLNSRITCDGTDEPIEGAFGLNSNRQILLPERVLSVLGGSQTIRFEILE
jgi:hypothetical protein